MEKVKGRRHTRLSRKHQVTIPVAVLRQARIQAGDDLEIVAAEDGRIVVTRAHDALDDFIGDLPGLSEATNLEKLRDEWER
ncbi:MAG: AbrB/MazE/SpoVT family DNA-binding domain-containing protein [bacterium]|jgi:bifunctional DNA-binding transcriptional regulator/antitoxin component of YhaV-PrlF toxin-antitoxin module|nr:AbrB/MazE/SpoVT family DNA-binding domain-containing protein [bacterium]